MEVALHPFPGLWRQPDRDADSRDPLNQHQCGKESIRLGVQSPLVLPPERLRPLGDSILHIGLQWDGIHINVPNAHPS
jgi:hypothetical protein